MDPSDQAGHYCIIAILSITSDAGVWHGQDSGAHDHLHDAVNLERIGGMRLGSISLHLDGQQIRSCLTRAVIFSVIWWVLADGDPTSWLFGGPTVLIATLLSIHLLPRAPVSVFGLAQFLSFFVWHSVAGGIDVASKALHRRIPIAPNLVEYRLRLPEGPGRILMTDAISLLPGTLSVNLQDECLTVHVLDESRPFMCELQNLELHISRLLGCDLREGEGF